MQVEMEISIQVSIYDDHHGLMESPPPAGIDMARKLITVTVVNHRFYRQQG